MIKKLFIIAGEASGDIHASNLVSALLREDNTIQIEGFGGERMKNAGATIHVGLDKLSIVGFVEVIKHLPTIKRNFDIAKKQILKQNPDAIILVDFPGFNLRMAKWAKSKGFKVYYYIAPQVWAWAKGRIEQMKKYIDELFVLLPFEEDFFKKNGIDAKYVGHPILEEIDDFEVEDNFLSKHQIPTNKKLIAVLPGSRVSEIENNMPVIVSVIEKNKDKFFLIAGRKSLEKNISKQLKNVKNVKIIFGETYKIMNIADAGIIKSGTSTLEAALLELPQVVVYKVNYISYIIAKRLIKGVKYASLVNLILDKETVKELLQHDLNTSELDKQLNLLLEKDYAENILTDYSQIKQTLRKEKYASEIIASYILQH